MKMHPSIRKITFVPRNPCKDTLVSVRAWLTNGHRGAHNEPVSLQAMLEVIDAALSTE